MEKLHLDILRRVFVRFEILRLTCTGIYLFTQIICPEFKFLKGQKYFIEWKQILFWNGHDAYQKALFYAD